MKQSIVFLDFEASGLFGATWPIEVGYASSCGRQDAFLLARQEEWSLADWDRNAASLHGISLEDLGEGGLSPATALARLEAGVQGAIVVSDAAEFDNFWLAQMAKAAGQSPSFSINDWCDVLPSGQTPAEREALAARARAKEPQRHRAGADARVMRAVWAASWAKASAAWAD